MILPPPPVPGDTPVTAREAAALVGVARATIDTWRDRGHLKPIREGKPLLFWASEVWACEAARKDSMRRTPRKPAPAC